MQRAARLAAPTTGPYAFSSTSAGTLIYLRVSCVGDELGCATTGGANNLPRLEVDVVAGQTYLLVIDSSRSGAGDYTVEINPL